MSATEQKFSWTQPICVGCWDERNPGRGPVAMLLPDPEECCYCGLAAMNGIYVHVDPKTVPHPTMPR